ncbi:hypothetical protein FXO37_03976 [Capsicum annuum]|nr:hypothetical protein FXO37_03976 [Capsicum annuum]
MRRSEKKRKSKELIESNHNDSSILLRATLNDVLGLYDSDSLHGNENSHGGYGGGPDRYLDTENEDLQNLVHKEMNRSHQSVQDKNLSISKGEEYDHGEDGVEEEEGAMHDDSYTDEQYTSGPIEGMSFHRVQSVFAFYKEHNRLTGFGVVKKSARKEAGQIKYVTFGCDRCRKTTARNQRKRIDCKARVNYHVMNDGSCIVKTVILDHNRELELTLWYFLPCHRKLSRSLKRSLVAHDIAGLRPTKRIRFLDFEAGGPERMTCTLKDYRNYILQQRRLQILSSDAPALHKFFLEM